MEKTGITPPRFLHQGFSIFFSLSLIGFQLYIKCISCGRYSYRSDLTFAEVIR